MADRTTLLRAQMAYVRCIRNAPSNNSDQAVHGLVGDENEMPWLEKARRVVKEALTNVKKRCPGAKASKNSPTSPSAHRSAAKDRVPAVPRLRFKRRSHPASKDPDPGVTSVACELPVSTSAEAPDQDAVALGLDAAAFSSGTTENNAATAPQTAAVAATDATAGVYMVADCCIALPDYTATESTGKNPQASSCAGATKSAARKQQQPGPPKVRKSSTKCSLKRRLKHVSVLERVTVRTLDFTGRQRSTATIEVRRTDVKVQQRKDKGTVTSVTNCCSDSFVSPDEHLPIDSEEEYLVIVENEGDLAKFLGNDAEGDRDADLSMREPEVAASCSSVRSETTHRSLPPQTEDQPRRVTRSMSAKIATSKAPLKGNSPELVGDSSEKAEPCDGMDKDCSKKAKPCDSVGEDFTIVFVASEDDVSAFSNGGAEADVSVATNVITPPADTAAPPSKGDNRVIAGTEQDLQCFSLRRCETSTVKLDDAESTVAKELSENDSIRGLSCCFQNMSLSSGLTELGATVTAACPTLAVEESDAALRDLTPHLAAQRNSTSQDMDVPTGNLSSELENNSDESFTVETLEQLVNALGINEYVESSVVSPSTHVLASAHSRVQDTESLLAEGSSAAQRDEDCAELIESGASINCDVIKLVQESDAAALCASVCLHQVPETKLEPQPCSRPQPRRSAKSTPVGDTPAKEVLESDCVQRAAHCPKNVGLSDEEDDDCFIVGVSYKNIVEPYNSSYQADHTVCSVKQQPDVVAPLAESSRQLSTKTGELHLGCRPDSVGKELSESGIVREEDSLKTAEPVKSFSKDYVTTAEGDESSAAEAAVSTVNAPRDYSTAVGELDAATMAAKSCSGPVSETAQDLQLLWRCQPGAIAKSNFCRDSTALSDGVLCEGLIVMTKKDGVAESSNSVDVRPCVSTTMQKLGTVTASARNSILVAETGGDVESWEQCPPATTAKGNAVKNAATMNLSKDCIRELHGSETVLPLNIEDKDSTSVAESVETDMNCDCSTATPESGEANSRTKDEQGLVVEAEQRLQLYRYCPPEAIARDNPPEDDATRKLSKGGCVEELGSLKTVEPFNSMYKSEAPFAEVEKNGVAEPLDALVKANCDFSSVMQGPDTSTCHPMSHNDQITTTGLELPSYGHCLPVAVARSDFTEDVAAEELSEGGHTKVFSTLEPLEPFDADDHVAQYFQNLVEVDLGYSTVTEVPKVVNLCDQFDSSMDAVIGHKLQLHVQCQADDVTRTNSPEDTDTEQLGDDCIEEPADLETETLNSADEVTIAESIALVARSNPPEDTVTEELLEDDCIEESTTLATESLNSADEVTIAESIAMATRRNCPEDTIIKQLSESDCIVEPGTLETELLNSADVAIAESIDSDTAEPVNSVEVDFNGSALFPELNAPTLLAKGVDSLLLETARELLPLWQGPLETTMKYSSPDDAGVTEEPLDLDCNQKVSSLKSLEPLSSVTNDDLTDQSVITIMQEPQNETSLAKDDSSLIVKAFEGLQSCRQCPLETAAGSNLPEDSVAKEFLKGDCIPEVKTVDPVIIANEDNSVISDGDKSDAAESSSSAVDVNFGSSTVMPDTAIASTENDRCIEMETGQQSQLREPRSAGTTTDNGPNKNTTTEHLLEADHIQELGLLETVNPLNDVTEDTRTVTEGHAEDVAESSENAVEADDDFSAVTQELETEISLAVGTDDLISETPPELSIQCLRGTITRSTSSENVMKAPSQSDCSLEVSALNEAKDVSSEGDCVVEDSVSDRVMEEPSPGDCSLEVGAFEEVEDSSRGDYTLVEDGGAVSKSSKDGVDARQCCSLVQEPDAETPSVENSSNSATSETGQKSPIHPHANKRSLETAGLLNSVREDDKTTTENHEKDVAEPSKNVFEVDDFPTVTLEFGRKMSLITGVNSLISETAPESCLECPPRTIARSDFPENDVTRKPSQDERAEEVSCLKKVKDSSSEGCAIVENAVSEFSKGAVDVGHSTSTVQEPVTASLPVKSSSSTAEAGQELVLHGQRLRQVNAGGYHGKDTVTTEPSKHECVQKFSFRNVKCVVVASSLGCDNSSVVGDDDGPAESPSENVKVDRSVGTSTQEPEAASHVEDSSNLNSESEKDSESYRLHQPESVTGSKSDKNTFTKELSNSDCVRGPCSHKALEPFGSVNQGGVTVTECDNNDASEPSNDSAGMIRDSAVLDLDAKVLCDKRNLIATAGQELQSRECPEAVTESVLPEDTAVSEQSKSDRIQEHVCSENVKPLSSVDENGSLVSDNKDGHAESSINGIGVDHSIRLPEQDASSHAMDGSSVISETGQGLQSQGLCQPENMTGNMPHEDPSTGELSRSESVEEVWSCQPETVMENRSFEDTSMAGPSRIDSIGGLVSSDTAKPAERSCITGEDRAAVVRRETEPGGTRNNSSDVNCDVDAVTQHPNLEASHSNPDLCSASGKNRRRRARKNQRKAAAAAAAAAAQSNPPTDAAVKCPPQGGDHFEGVRVCFDYSNNLRVTVAQAGTEFVKPSDNVVAANCVTNSITEESGATSLCAGAGSSAVSRTEQGESQRRRRKRTAKRKSPKAVATEDPSNLDCVAGPSGHSKTAQPLESFSGVVYEPHMGRHVIEKEIIPDTQDFGVSAVRYRISWLPAQFM